MESGLLNKIANLLENITFSIGLFFMSIAKQKKVYIKYALT